MTKFFERASILFRKARDKLKQPQTKKFIYKGIKRGIQTIIDNLPMSQKTKNLFRKYKKEIDQRGFNALKKIGQSVSVGQVKQALEAITDESLSKQQKLRKMKSLSTKVLQNAVKDGQIIRPQLLYQVPTLKQQRNFVRQIGSIKKNPKKELKTKDQQVQQDLPLTL